MPVPSLLHRLTDFLSAPTTTTAIVNPWRNRTALLALAPLAAALVAVTIWAPWHSNFDIDSFTRYLQVVSLADHGSAGFANGPIDGNPELTPRWLFPAHGLVWGPYPVLGDLPLAIGAKLDGHRGVIRVIWLLFIQACAFTYALTYRLTRRPAIAVAAAYSLALGTSAAFWGTMTAPFIPAAAYGITGLDFMSRSFAEETRRRAFALAAVGGVFASFAVGSHLVGAAAWAAVPAACFLVGPPRSRLVRPLGYVFGSAPGLTLMAWVNRIRFDVFSPFSYGPCDTEGCLGGSTETNAQNGRAFLAFALPYAPYVLLFAAAAWIVRRSWRGVAVVMAVAAMAGLIPATPSGFLFRNLARTVWATLFDTGSVDLGYPKWGDNPGVFSFWLRIGNRIGGPWCVRSLFECSPVLIAALLPLGRRGTRDTWGLGVPLAERRPSYWMLIAACTGVLTVILMRANLPGANAVGMPFLNYRYLVTVLPAFTVLAFVAVAELPFRAWHILLAIGVGASGAAALSSQPNDEDLLRRQLTHWLPLGLAFLAWGSASGARLFARARHRRAASHVAAFLVALMVGCGVSVTLGIDRIVVKIVRGFQDADTDEVARCTPDRLILVGGASMTHSLILLDRKKIQFIDPMMGPRDGSNVASLLLDAIAPDNPAFLVDENAESPWLFEWPGLAFEKIPGCARVRRIVRTDPPAAPPEP